MRRGMGHLWTVLRHKYWVARYCFAVGLYWQGLVHDLSKFSPAELFPGMRFFQGSRSPADAEREKLGTAQSWLHHKGRNRHHIEYWMDYDPEVGRFGPLPMPLPFVAESICDRISASLVYRGALYTVEYPLEYYLKGREWIPVHPETDRLFRYYLGLLAQRGEQVCLQSLRAQIQEARRLLREGEPEAWLRPQLPDMFEEVLGEE